MAAILKAIDAWGEAMPDWIRSLAEACERSSQNQVAKDIGYSGALVSNVLGKKYTGDLRRVEEIVRGTLMSETLNCPQLGKLPLSDCARWQVRATKPTHANSLDMRMRRACRKCPRFTQSKEVPNVRTIPEIH